MYLLCKILVLIGFGWGDAFSMLYLTVGWSIDRIGEQDICQKRLCMKANSIKTYDSLYPMTG